MKRCFTFIVALLTTCLLFAQGQDEKYDQFVSLFDAKDTTAMARMLADWDRNDPEYYACAVNYYLIKAMEDEQGLGILYSTFDKGISMFPDRLDIRVGKIRSLIDFKRYDEAIAELCTSLDYSVKNGNQWLWKRGKPASEDGQEFFIDLVHQFYSELEEAMDKKEQLEKMVDKALSFYPADIRLRNDKVILLIERWEFEDAIDSLVSIRKDVPDDDVVNMNLGYLYYTSAQYDEAIGTYTILLASSDTSMVSFAKSAIEECNSAKEKEYFKIDIPELKIFAKSKDYKALLKRYISGDESLSTEDVARLYYGFAFTDSYSVRDNAPTELFGQMYEKGDFQGAYDCASDYLAKTNPFSLGMLLRLYYAAQQLGKDVSPIADRYLQLADAILSTGSGRSLKEAIYVIRVSDEYDILSYWGGYEFGKQDLIEENGSAYDALYYNDSNDNARRIYFNVDILFLKYNSLYGR